MSWRFNVSGLSQSRKTCLNLCSRSWLRVSLSLVSNLTSFGLWHLKGKKGKKNSEKIIFYFQMRNIIVISCVVWSHRSRNNIESTFSRSVSEYFKEGAQFPVPSSFFRSFQTYLLIKFLFRYPSYSACNG